MPDKAPAIRINSTELYTGFDNREQRSSAFLSMVYAFNRNIDIDGFLIRAQTSYEKTSTVVAGGTVDGLLIGSHLLIGYQKILTWAYARLYVGPDYERYRLAPNKNYGSNWENIYGVKVRGIWGTDTKSPIFAELVADFSSASNRYLARGRIGQSLLEGVIIGPEGILSGNRTRTDNRAGIFVLFRSLGLQPVDFYISGGYSNTSADRGGGSAYGALEFYTLF
jgi:hypothetical protein